MIRHAQAQNCRVRLWLDGALCLEVCDDGRGLPERPEGGIGLASMRERAEELGGTFLIEPANPHGTRVLVRLPESPDVRPTAEGDTSAFPRMRRESR